VCLMLEYVRVPSAPSAIVGGGTVMEVGAQEQRNANSYINNRLISGIRPPIFICSDLFARVRCAHREWLVLENSTTTELWRLVYPLALRPIVTSRDDNSIN
jgi:hypothetical protein